MGSTCAKVGKQYKKTEMLHTPEAAEIRTRAPHGESSTHRIIGGAHKAVAPIAYRLEIRVPGTIDQACERRR